MSAVPSPLDEIAAEVVEPVVDPVVDAPAPVEVVEAERPLPRYQYPPVKSPLVKV